MQDFLLWDRVSRNLRDVLLICFSVMISHSLYGQISLTPRLSYNWANYRVNACHTDGCPNTRSNIGIGLNAYNKLYKDLNLVAGINFYTNKVSYPDGGFSVGDLEFRHFDIKIGIENSIFNERTKVGVGLQLEIMYSLRDIDNRTNQFVYPSMQNYYGFELTARHQLKNNIELFFDAFFNLNLPNKNSVVLLYHTNFQVGIGYPLKLKI